MEPWAPQRPPWPQGRPTAPPLDPNRDLWREGYRRPVPHPWHNGERLRQWQDIRGSPQPQQDPSADHQPPHHVSRPGDRRQPASSVDHYQGAIPADCIQGMVLDPRLDPTLLSACEQIVPFLLPFLFIPHPFSFFLLCLAPLT